VFGFEGSAIVVDDNLWGSRGTMTKHVGSGIPMVARFGFFRVQ